MKVTLEKTFPLPAAADIAWSLLQDIQEVAACMPGASITERIDATHYKGNVAVKFGPASMAFRGEIEIAAVEAAAKTIRLIGKGTDTTGSSGASMDLTARIEATTAAACNLHGNSEVSMSGKAAAFGGRMMGSVADQILKQFAANFANKAQAAGSAQRAAPPASPGETPGSTMAVGSGRAPTLPASYSHTPPDPAVDSQAASVGADLAAARPVPAGDAFAPPAGAASAPSASSASRATAVEIAAPSVYPAQPPSELNGFALIWAVFKDWLRSLFGAKRA